MLRFRYAAWVLSIVVSFSGSVARAQQAQSSNDAEAQAESAAAEDELLTGARQITFDGRRAGEGYFSSDGTRMVFQSERDPQNPFYQIYVTDLETGDIERVSPGFGKTTCAWIHPNGDKILFASTQDDPEAREKQQQEIDMQFVAVAVRHDNVAQALIGN